ncbi:GNAT family N-acetyltransferase [Paenibacillus montaniterrae]|uniref:GNAT family N-acetyltransferase n=1 Tax=Paenibacillus montaniterrae TaxID=429341 RepID=UPI002484BF6D|nr:GNAT family N-acetyltransferase [Paenibacillus montaniterrae]
MYWFYVDDRPIGYGKLRHYLTEKLLEHGGHIGYVIRPSERRKNYGKYALKELLQKAREIGIQEVLLTCDEANIASRKIIEANNGMLKEVQNSNCKYWITQF